MYPPQSPTRITNNSIMKLLGASHCVKTSRMRFWAFSYSMGEPCGRSFQVIMYFDDMCVLLPVCVGSHARATQPTPPSAYGFYGPVTIGGSEDNPGLSTG